MHFLASLAFLLATSTLAFALPAPEQVAIRTPEIQRSTSPDRRFETGAMLTLQGELFLPEGTGPFPAVVHLHGCGGPVPARDNLWTERLLGWGYAVLRLDSLTPRGKTSVCPSPADLPPFNRAGDAYAAKAWLSGHPAIDRKHIVLAGWSHGGWTVLRALGSPPSQFGAPPEVGPFQAGIAFYPLCTPPLDVQAPILILQGEADGLTAANLCRAMGPLEQVRVEYYAGATHGFDEPGVDAIFQGHPIRHHPEAVTAAVAAVRAFLAQTSP